MLQKAICICGILSNPDNFAYTLNSDGTPVFKSSNYSLWPIHLTLNELPPKLRYKHVILAALSFGPSEPRMNVFLKPFVEQAKTLAETGVSWRKTGNPTNSKLVGLMCCVDSVARPQMQNTTEFNGYFGCGFCLHPGTLVERQVTYPVGAEDYEDRTNDSMLEDMEQALQQNASVNGVKGPSPLLCGDLCQVDSSSSTEPYYVGSPRTLRILDDRLKSFQTPHIITRMP